MVALFSFCAGLSAQITRDEADRIVLERMSCETHLFTVYATEDMQTNMSLYTSFTTLERIELDYACWVYYIHSRTGAARYMLVSESTGNLIEVNTMNGGLPASFGVWRVVSHLSFDCEDELFYYYLANTYYDGHTFIDGKSEKIFLCDCLSNYL